MDKVEPKATLSRMLATDPNRKEPNVDKVEPMRSKDRTDWVLPKPTKSKAEMQEPAQAIPITEQAVPDRRTCLNYSARPNCT
jgi:hypothetical protein